MARPTPPKPAAATAEGASSVQTVLTVRRLLPAPIAQVYRAWTEPERMREWCAPEGMDVAEAVLEVRPGGRFRIAMRAPDGELSIANGTYQEVVPERRLVYTWRWEHGEGGETLLTVEFHARGQQTELVLTHARFPDAAARDSHLRGWTSIMARLERWLGG